MMEFLQSVGVVVLGFSLGKSSHYLREKREQSKAKRAYERERAAITDTL